MTPEELKTAQDEAQKKVAARIAELKQCEGKTYARNDGTGSTVKVIQYDGIKQKSGVSAHTFLVEGLDSRWTPPATEFLAQWHEVPAAAQPTTSNEVI